MTKLNKIRKFVIVGDEKSSHFPLVPILNQFNYVLDKTIDRNETIFPAMERNICGRIKMSQSEAEKKKSRSCHFPDFNP